MIIPCLIITLLATPPTSETSDEQLKRICIEAGVVSEDAELDKALEEGDSLTAWVLVNHEDKVKVIDELKEKFKEEGIIIEKSSEWYVRTLHMDIITSIERGETPPPIGNLFKAVALISGDFKRSEDDKE